jgi:hypothetical protein
LKNWGILFHGAPELDNYEKGRDSFMTDYGRGGVLAAATSLPATSAAGLILANHAHPAIVAGLFAVSVTSLAVVITYLVRYLVNR